MFYWHIVYQILFVLIVSFLNSSCYPSLDYEDICGSGNGLGACKAVNECPTAQTALMHRKKHGLERCGFHGLVEAVCCPDFKETVTVPGEIDGIWGRLGPQTPNTTAIPSETPTPTPIDVTNSHTERKSEVVCKEYASHVAPGITYQILGGENASLGEFPHMAQLGFQNPDITDGLSWDCGGALISDRFVLSAAHCSYKADGTAPIRVRLGLVDMENINPEIVQEFGILNFLVHDDYQRRSKINDIGLIELDNKVTLTTTVQPACLYQKPDNPEGLVITGWGYTAVEGDQSSILQKARIHAVETGDCSKVYERRLSKTITSLQICCVSDDGLVDTCQGDSGGPLQIQISEDSNIYTIVGVTSFGMGCGGSTPGVYTRVSSYLDWIESIVWP